jgi:ABC-type glycerol-3-phosphate transport system permease component
MSATATPVRDADQRAAASARFWRREVRLIVLLAALVLISLVSFVPLGWMLITSLKTKPEVYLFPPTLWPRVPQFHNYADAWNYGGMRFTRWTLNTLFISLSVLVGVLLSSSLCAYGFARIRFPGRDFWFILTLASVMLPPQVTLIPLYILFFRIDWLDTFKPLIVPAWFGGGAINIFLIRQFFLGIPLEIEDAARIDGANRLQIWWTIFLPLSLPALTTVAIFTFQGTWSDFYGPLIFLSSADNFTLALGMNLFRGTYTEEMHYMMAIAFLMTIPMILIFFFAQRYYIRGVVLSGVKG